MIRAALQTVLAHHEVADEPMEAAVEEMLSGDASPVLVSAFAIALRMKGETAGERAAAARVLRRRCERVETHGAGPLLDTCGTGGDGAGTFNVSTVAAIVVASCGVRVAKHGNRAVSSRAGSADLLEALGIEIDLDSAAVAASIDELGIGFLFAPAHHEALKHAAPVRRELGTRTFFNLLGPLANPAGATHQLLGVYDGNRVAQMADVLGRLGTTAAWVVHGEGGVDEIVPWGTTRVAELRDGRVTERVVRPEDFGVTPVEQAAIAGGSAAQNARIARDVLEGAPGAHRAAVVLNAGAALVIAGRVATPREGAELAGHAIDGGEALRLLDRWIARSHAS